MPKALSVDLRTRVVSAIANGLSCRQAAIRFGLSPSTAIRWQALVRTQGDVKPKPQGGNQRSHIVDIHSEVILGLVAEKDDMTLDEISAALAQRSITISRVAIWRFFKRRKMTFKKSRRTPASKTGRIS
jgi:transposase